MRKKRQSYFKLQPSTCVFEQETFRATQHPFRYIPCDLGPSHLLGSKHHLILRTRQSLPAVFLPIKGLGGSRCFQSSSSSSSVLIAVLSAARAQGISLLRGRCQSHGGLKCRLRS